MLLFGVNCNRLGIVSQTHVRSESSEGENGFIRSEKKSLLGVKENNIKSSTRVPSPTKRKDRSDEKSKDRSKDKRATKESSEKDRGRDKTRKRCSASSGSSSTRSRCSSTSSSGSSTSTSWSSGSSSFSASSRSGSQHIRSSSSGSPSPSRRRHDNRRSSHSKSKPPKRDEKERKRRSPSPKPTKVHIERLTRNVTKDHIMEIFSTYGKIKMIDMPVERILPHLSKGYVYVEFENPDEAEKTLKHMNGGQIDGQEITATAVLAPWPRPLPQQFSPPRRMLPLPPMWRRSPPRMRRRSRSARRRSPVRRGSQSPRRHRHRSRSISNSSRCPQGHRFVPL
ncbi:RNA-binding protein with serine-rich domain 1-like [Rattus norvegicus]|uniref:RNA-binding protein with serine-rich domain 1-like n=1 Tax=Rattus norvegicus TaxID=10116 RepID=UPI0001CF41A9|nr:RNA-binding protein with serine-rich domain 1-like [Rattus norvegicus]